MPSVQSALFTSVAWNGPGLEVEEAGQLALDALDVVPQRLEVEQVALLGTTARVADHARGPAGQRERAVPGELEATQEQLADEVADVQRVRRGIEADVDAGVALGQPGRERVAVGGLVDQATGVEVGQQVHSGDHVGSTCDTSHGGSVHQPAARPVGRLGDADPGAGRRNLDRQPVVVDDREPSVVGEVEPERLGQLARAVRQAGVGHRAAARRASARGRRAARRRAAGRPGRRHGAR